MDEDENYFLISDMEEFIHESYVFSFLNLIVSLSPEVNNKENSPQERDMIKEKMLDDASALGVEKEDIDEMKSMYPLHNASEILKNKISVNEEGKHFIPVHGLMKATEEISKGMLFALFAKLQKEGVLELYWDADKSDFVYGPKKKESKDESKIINTKKRKPRKK
jgi:hypothetical protein